jgi:two-component system nitrate/nitrite response regulator NarL
MTGDLKIMGQEFVFAEKILTIAVDPYKNVSTALICANTIMRSGIELILSGSCFIPAESTIGNLPDSPVCSGDLPSMVIICEYMSLKEYADLLDGLVVTCPSARKVLMADHLKPEEVIYLFDRGLDGYCSTSMAPNALVKSLELVMQGERYMHSSIALPILLKAGERSGFAPSGSNVINFRGVSRADAGRVNVLSDRETQILKLLMQGASNKVIARDLGLAEATVKVHVKAILKKVRVENRTQAAMWAVEFLNDKASAMAALS